MSKSKYKLAKDAALDSAVRAPTQDVGYKDGLSQFTHRAAARRDLSFGHAKPRKSGTTAEIIAYERMRMRNLQAELLVEDDPKRRAKILHNMEIKRAFLARLWKNSPGDV